jgi:SNF2 family DNA or RNA helicase
MFTPMKHQKHSIKFLSKRNEVFDMSDPGTGKTAVQILDVAATSKHEKHLTLIFAPKSLLRTAWDNDFKKFAPHLKREVATAQNRTKALNETANVYITNHDAAVDLAKKPPSFWKKFKGGTLIIDESSAFKHRTSARSKAMVKISKYFKRVRLMSGTPNTNGICDIWHQVYILDYGQRLGTSFFAFRAAVCTPVQTGPMPNMVRWEDKPHAEEAVAAMISDIVVRHRFEDCVDIPANHQYSMPFELSSKHFAAYKRLENDSLLLLRDSSITAINGAALYTKLLQLASGAAYNDAGSYTLIDSDRYDLVLDLVEERRHSVVFFNWQHQRDELIKRAEKRDMRFALIDGSVTKKGERERVVEAYQKGLYDVLFAHPQSAGHGLTLTKGTATIWPSPTPNLEHYLQGLKRIHRIGQTEKTETIMIVAPGTIEEQVYEALLAKDARMTNLLTLLKKAA